MENTNQPAVQVKPIGNIIENLQMQNQELEEQLQEADRVLDNRQAALYAALSNAQTEIRNAEKNQDNPFLKSNYADLAAVMNACRGALAKNGLSLIQRPLDPRFTDGREVLRLHTMLVHKDGGSIGSEWEMPIEGSEKTPLAQRYGITMTYMRRYSAAAILGIAQADEDAEALRKDPSEFARISPSEVDEILMLAEDLFGDRADEVIKRMIEKVFAPTNTAIKQVGDIPEGQTEVAKNLLKNQARREKEGAAKPAPKQDAKKPQSGRKEAAADTAQNSTSE